MDSKRSVESMGRAVCSCNCGLPKADEGGRASAMSGRASAMGGRPSGLTEKSSPVTDRSPMIAEKRPTVSVKSAAPEGEAPEGENEGAPTGPPPTVLMQTVIILTMGLALLLVGLDSTITSTVVPTITDYFHYAGDIGWYTSAYLLATSASQLYYGRLYTMFSSKWVLLMSLVIFEIGAAIAGGAPNSPVFIVGRAVSGLGRAGICSGVMTVLKEILPIEKRPIAGMTVGAIETIAVVSAPVFGGVLADKTSWRWCFLINVPAGAIAFGIIFWLVPNRRPAIWSPNRSVIRTLIFEFDNVGALLIAGASVCMVLFLQWGGFEYEWNSPRIIGLIVASGVLLVGFVIWEYFQGERAILPLRYYKSRTVAMGALFSFAIDGAVNLVDSYLAIWFQLIKYASPIKSGLMLLPMILSMLTGVAFAGFGTSYIGYYVPFMILCSIFVPVGTGLLTTLKPDSGKGMWIGYQVVFGIGCGFGLQQPLMAAQTLESKKGGHGVEIGTAVILFTQTLGGTLTAAIAQNLLLNRLIKDIPKVIPRISGEVVKHTGLADLVRDFTKAEVQVLLPVVNTAIVETFKVALICAVFGVPAALFMKWKPLKKEDETKGGKNVESGSSEDIALENRS